MKKYLLMALFAMSLFIPQAHAQWVVTDPGNFAGNIANSIKEIATASKTVKNTLSGFKEVEKLYNDTKKYYDARKQVNNLIGDAYKVKECILMVGDISDLCNLLQEDASGPKLPPHRASRYGCWLCQALGTEWRES